MTNTHDDLRKYVERYQKAHPEIRALLKKLRITQEEYEKARAAISVKRVKTGSTYSTSVAQSYNAYTSTPA